ncbi:AraC family transcriptional regulator [Aliikangiella sp. IMCC44359]|uniref:AraC family transcriptional regulator n=1 Tax=Aliikangiella sp. IMCC44359 TaxID=3459125 RepID=UPI00403AB18B
MSLISRYITKLAFLSLLYWVCFPTKSNQFEHQFQFLSSQNGLTQNTIIDIEEDANGNIWIATENGLNRFDGVRVTQYLKDNPDYSIAENNIIDLQVSNDGKLWVLTPHYILFESNDQFEVFSRIEDITTAIDKNSLRQLKFLKNNALVVIGAKAFVILNQDKKLIDSVSFPLFNNKTWFLMKTIVHMDDLIFATNRGLWIYQKERQFYQRNNWPTVLKEKHIQSAISSNQQLVVNGVDRLFILDNEYNLRKSHLFKQNSFSSYPYLLAQDQSRNRFWLASSSEIFQWEYSSNDWTKAAFKKSKKKSTLNSFIYQLFVDSNSNVWVGTSMQGVLYLSKNAQKFKVLKQKNTTKPMIVTAISPEYDKKFWIGTSEGEIYQYHKKQLSQQTVKFDNFLNNPKVISQITGIIKQGNYLWIATYVGLLRYNLDSKQVENWFNDSEKHNAFSDISTIKIIDNELWGLSSIIGIFKVSSDQKVTTYFRQQSYWDPAWNKLRFISMLETQNDIYFGTLQGKVIVYNKNKHHFKAIEVFNSFEKRILNLVLDQNNHIWFNSDDALYEYNPQSNIISRRLSARETGQSAFYSLVFDEHQQIWIGGSNALVLYDYLSQSKQVFTAKDGAIGNEYNSVSQLFGKHIYLGTIDGVLQIDTSHVYQRPSVPTVKLDNIGIKNPYNNELKSFKQWPENLVLNDKQQLNIYFSAQKRLNANQIQLRYKLNNEPWRLINNWQLTLDPLHFKTGDNQLTIQSSWLYSENWTTNYHFTLSVLGLFNIPLYAYWILSVILLVFFVGFIFYVLRIWQASEAHLNVRVEKRTQELFFKVEQVEKIKSILLKFGDVISLNVSNNLIHSLHQREWVFIELWKLWDSINRNSLSILSQGDEYRVKMFLENIIHDDFIFNDIVLPIDFNDQDHLQSNISQELLQALFKISYLFTAYFSTAKKLSVNIEKITARRGGVSFIAPLDKSELDRNSSQFIMFESLFACFNEMTKMFNYSSELMINDSIFTWKIQFPVSQIWRGSLAKKEKIVNYNTHNLNSQLVDSVNIKHQALNLSSKSYEEKTHLIKQIGIIYLSKIKFDYVEPSEPLPKVIIQSLVESQHKMVKLVNHKAINDLFNNSKNNRRLAVIVLDCFLEQTLIDFLIEKNAETMRSLLVLCPCSASEIFEKQIDIPENFLILPWNTPPLIILQLVEFLISDNLYEKADTNKKVNVDSSLNNKALSQQQINTNDSDKRWLNDNSSVFLDELNQYLSEYSSDESLDVEKVAFALNMSSRHLTRKMKEFLNMTTGDYIKQYRLKRSLSLLKKGFPIHQVSKMAGFSSRSYFSTCFKKAYGVVPSEYKTIKHQAIESVDN